MANNTDYTRLLDGNALKAIKAWVEGKGYKTVNYYPSRSYTSGLQISTAQGGSSVTALYVPYMTASQYGVAKVYAVRSSAITATTGGTTSDRYYGVEKDSNGKLFVNVPWTGGGSGSYLPLSGGTMTGNINFQNGHVYHIGFNDPDGDDTETLQINAKHIDLRTIDDYLSYDTRFVLYNAGYSMGIYSQFRYPPDGTWTKCYTYVENGIELHPHDLTSDSQLSYKYCYIGSVVHNVKLTYSTSVGIRFNIRDSYGSNSHCTSYSQVAALLQRVGHVSQATALICSGRYSSYQNTVCGVYSSNGSSITLVYISSSGITETTTTINSNATITDTLLNRIIP